MARKYSLDEKSIEYLQVHITVTDAVIEEIESHARFYRRKARICAWYENMDDFRSEWCDILGYKEEEILSLLINHEGYRHGEIRFLKNAPGIVRYET